MPGSSHDSIDRTVAKTREWIDDVAAELGIEDHHEAYRILRVFLRMVRDRVGPNEAVQLAAQLPELLRGAYYEGWVPSQTPKRYDRNAFLDRFAEEAMLAGETEASYAAAAAMTVLRRRISAGEIEDVLANFPADLREMFAGSAAG